MTARPGRGDVDTGSRGPLLPAGYGALGQPRVRRGGARRRPRRRSRWWLAAAAPALVALYVVWSLAGALTTPGNEGFSAKWADWLRSHHAASIVSSAEAWYYSHHAPAKGGRPEGLNTLPSLAAGPPGSLRPATHHPEPGHHPVVAPPPLPAPRAVSLVVHPALAGEGRWKAVGPVVAGHPAMYVSQFRADTVYTSELTSAVWIDPLALRLALVPGLTEPGGTWPQPPYITTAERPTVQAAFNGGFRFADAQGGIYVDGRTAVPLRAGAASMVVYRDGRVDVGAWGTEVTMTPQVSAVLQNLVPMVDHGAVSAAATYADTSIWGSTLGAATVVARSGIGVTGDGAVVYVAGPALTARTLAESLQRAGAVRAMTLDINPEWVTFNLFSHPDRSHPARIVPSSLYPQMQRPADRYLGPTEESRDFFTVSVP